MNVDVTGILSTFTGVSRGGNEIVQRVLIVSPENVTVYCSRNGRPLTFLPIKGLDIEWSYKRSLADLANDGITSTARASTMNEGFFPPMPDSLDSASAPVYCATIADARAQYSATERMLVELQCRPFSGATSTQFTLGHDSPTDSITTYYTNSASLGTGRINKIVGTIQKDSSNNYWIEVDSGPNWTEDDFLGSVKAVQEGSIVWAKTFGDGLSLSATLSGKVVSRTFPSLGYFYIQEPTGSSGIRVNDFSMASLAGTGDVVDVEGDLSTENGERVINASSTTIVDSTTITSLGMNNKSLAGGDLNVFTPGAYGAFGLNNVGLLVRAWGKVTAVGSDYFYLDDGSNCDDGSGANGVRVVNVSDYMPGVNDYVAVTGISGLATYDTNLARTIRIADSSDFTAISPPAPPVLMEAVNTGGGRVSLYWRAVSGAIGYNMYRSTESGVYDYDSPVNGGTLVTTLSYPGSEIHMFTDTGLVNETEYYYTIKAVDDRAESKPSNEESATPNTDGIPWDSNDPSLILTAFRAAFPQVNMPAGSVRVVGPNGFAFKDGISYPIPPNYTINEANQAVFDNGDILPLRESSESTEFTILAADDFPIDRKTGPIRGIYTRQGYSFRGVSGNVTLPSLLQCSPQTVVVKVFDKQKKRYVNKSVSSGDIPLIYFGTRSLDAGVQWSPVRNNFQPCVFYDRPGVGHSGLDKYKINVDPTDFGGRYELGERIYMEFGISDKTDGLVYLFIRGSQGTVRISGMTTGSKQFPKSANGIRVKRMHTIAQTVGEAHKSQGYERTNSCSMLMKWEDGKVQPASGGSYAALWNRLSSIFCRKNRKSKRH